MNAAQRRRARRVLAQEWPAGMLVTHPHVDGQMRVEKPATSWAGHLNVIGLRSGKRATISPRLLKRVPS